MANDIQSDPAVANTQSIAADGSMQTQDYTLANTSDSRGADAANFVSQQNQDARAANMTDAQLDAIAQRQADYQADKADAQATASTADNSSTDSINAVTSDPNYAATSNSRGTDAADFVSQQNQQGRQNQMTDSQLDAIAQRQADYQNGQNVDTQSGDSTSSPVGTPMGNGGTGTSINDPGMGFDDQPIQGTRGSGEPSTTISSGSEPPSSPGITNDAIQHDVDAGFVTTLPDGTIANNGPINTDHSQPPTGSGSDNTGSNNSDSGWDATTIGAGVGGGLGLVTGVGVTTGATIGAAVGPTVADTWNSVTSNLPDLSNTGTAANPDGSSTTLNNDGSTTTSNPDGTVVTQTPDGTTISQDGATTSTFEPNGTVTTTNSSSDSSSSGSIPDGGSSTTVYPDGTEKTYFSDGSELTVKPDGTQTYVDKEGTTTVADSDGNVLSQTDRNGYDIVDGKSTDPSASYDANPSASNDNTNTGNQTGGLDFNPNDNVSTYNPNDGILTPAEQLAMDIAMLEALNGLWSGTGAIGWNVEDKKERVDVIEQSKEKKEGDTAINAEQAQKALSELLPEMLQPLAEQLGLQLKDGELPFSEETLLSMIQKQLAGEHAEGSAETAEKNVLAELLQNGIAQTISSIEQVFTAPNGDVFELIVVRDAFGNIISRHFVDAGGNIISEGLVDQALHFVRSLQGTEDAVHWDANSLSEIFSSGSMAETTAFLDGNFDIMNVIQQANESFIPFNDNNAPDPSSLVSMVFGQDPNNPMNDPNQPGNWINGATEGGETIFDQFIHTLMAEDRSQDSGLESELQASLDPLNTAWVDPVFDQNIMANLEGAEHHGPLDFLHQQKDKEFAEHQRREEEERERALRAKAELEAKEYAAAMMAAIRQAAQKELADKQMMQEQLLQREMRRKYVVLPGDTLESIAQKMFYNRGLATLIYEINRSLIPSVMKDGKRKLQLKPRTIIFLPTQSEIKRFNNRMFGKKPAFEYDESTTNTNNSGETKKPKFSLLNILNVGARETGLNGRDNNKDNVVDLSERRRANIQNVLGKLHEASQIDEYHDDRIVYTCRLGDTLRSIALRHPALKDVTLWKLIAELNGLSTEMDDFGHPVVVLSRNTKLRLPLTQEIEDYKNRGKKRKPTLPQIVPSGPVSSVPSEGVQSGPASGSVPSTPITDDANAESSSAEEMVRPDIEEYEPEVDNLLRVMRVQIQNEEKDEHQYTVLAERCRISRKGEAKGGSVPFTISLEIKKNNTWVAVVTYEINADQSWRYEATTSGSRKGKQINLPVRLAKQMAENDITKNWRQYAESNNVAIS